MIKNFTDIAFTKSVKEEQRAKGSRNNYLGMEEMQMNTLYQGEKDFIQSRDMFYISSVGHNGWPYVQFRGGPKGFLKVLSPNKIGFANYRGNMQYISYGNLVDNAKAALILIDYPSRTRLKIWAEVELVDSKDATQYQDLVSENYAATIDHFFVLNVKALDWNCPQHITPRYTKSEFEEYRNGKA